MMTVARAQFDLRMLHCRKALLEFDAGQAERDRVFKIVENMETAQVAFDAEDSAIEKLRLAFYEDTKDRNSRADCMEVGVDFVRRCVAHAIETFGEIVAEDGDSIEEAAKAVAVATENHDAALKKVSIRQKRNKTALQKT